MATSLGDPAPRRPVGEKSIVTTALTRFVLLSLAALVVLGLGTVFVSRQVADDESRREARIRSKAMASGIAAPLVNADVRAGNDAATDRLAEVLENRMRDGSVSHVLLWDREGRVIWADDTSLIGQQFDLTPDTEALFGTERAFVPRRGDEGESTGSPHEYEESLLEVYVGAHDADGVPFVFEAYIPPRRVNADRNTIIKAMLPVGLGGLMLFQLAVLPMAFSLARRVNRARRQRSKLLSLSLSSWHEERRRLAHELHDGVIQDLSAASYALPSVVASLPADASADTARATSDQIGTILQRDLRELRTLIMDLLPSDLRGAGLSEGLQRLAARGIDHGVEVELETSPGLDLDPTISGLVYRVVREGLRNVERHSGARTASVVVSRDGGGADIQRVDDSIDIRVADDGRGLDGGPRSQDGHFGLNILGGLVHEVGGMIELRNRPGGGSILHVRIPAVLPE